MSCLPGNPCYKTPLSNDCGVDPISTPKISTDQVFYTGPNLPCIGVDTCTSLTESLSLINTALCPDNLVSTFFSAISNNSPICTETQVTPCQPICNDNCISDNTMNINCISSNDALYNIIESCLTTTTTTTLPPTTTSTTTAIPCFCYSVESSTVHVIAIQWIDCSGNGLYTSGSSIPGGSYKIGCAQEDSVVVTSLYPYTISGGIIPCTSNNDCTTTTTTTAMPDCSEYEVCSTFGNGGGFFQYYPCGSTNIVLECLDEDSCTTVCADNNCGIIPITNIASITIGIECTSTTTTTTTLDCSNNGGTAMISTTTTSTTANP